MSGSRRVLTGTGPSGPLRLGHYAGALDNWLELQHAYDCYFLIADCPRCKHRARTTITIEGRSPLLLVSYLFVE